MKKAIKAAFTLFFILLACDGYCLNLNSIKSNILIGDYKSAIAEGERLIAREPHSAELYYLLGLSYLKDGNYLRASDIFEIIIKEFKDSRFKDEAAMGLGDTYLLRGEPDKAADCYKRLMNSNPNTKLKGQLYYRLSEIGFKQGNTSQGAEYLSKLKSNFPLSPELKQGQAVCAIEKKDSSFYYSVQVGSFVNPDNAHNLSQKLSGAGYPTYIEEFVSPAGQKTFKVGVGKLKSRSEAEELSKKLTQEGYPTKICP